MYILGCDRVLVENVWCKLKRGNISPLHQRAMGESLLCANYVI